MASINHLFQNQTILLKTFSQFPFVFFVLEHFKKELSSIELSHRNSWWWISHTKRMTVALWAKIITSIKFQATSIVIDDSNDRVKQQFDWNFFSSTSSFSIFFFSFPHAWIWLCNIYEKRGREIFEEALNDFLFFLKTCFWFIESTCEVLQSVLLLFSISIKERYFLWQLERIFQFNFLLFLFFFPFKYIKNSMKTRRVGVNWKGFFFSTILFPLSFLFKLKTSWNWI